MQVSCARGCRRPHQPTIRSRRSEPRTVGSSAAAFAG